MLLHCIIVFYIIGNVFIFLGGCWHASEKGFEDMVSVICAPIYVYEVVIFTICFPATIALVFTYWARKILSLKLIDLKNKKVEDCEDKEDE